MSKPKQQTKMTSDEADLKNKIKDLKIENSDINILLLGETGVGKSTFINAIANYLTYTTLKTAVKENLLVLIPTTFKIQDKDNEWHIIKVGSQDKNEFLDTGVSATQDVKTYVFPIWNGKAKVRLIDTPGMGDTRGIEQDNINSENILNYIAQLHELHAICFLFKPNQSRNTVFFQYCMSQILSRLDKSASKNIVFIFTNTRGADYGPGDTIALLQKIVEDIRSRPPHVEIPINRNIFCFDNEAFRYLAAVKNKVEVENSVKERNKESWKTSSAQCWSLINYINGDIKFPPLKPHFIKSTNAINEARRMIVQLSQPLAEISQLINQNVNALRRHEANLKLDNMSLDDLKKKLYMPVVNLEVTKLTQPVTVCTHRGCAEVYKVGDNNNWHYKQRCHDPCYLTNVPKEIIGSPELVNCAAIDRSNRRCIKCKCDFSIHMHVYYMTKTKEDKIVDPNIKQNINTKEKLLENARKLMKDICNKKEELDQEHQIIVKCCARFAHFLQNNAITPFNDSYKEYIEYLINRERSLGSLCDLQTVDHLQKLLREYEETKRSFEEALKLNQQLGRTDVAVSPKEIQESIQELYRLKHNGKKIKELYECQKKSRSKEHENTEYVHKIPVKKDDKEEVKKEKTGNDNKKDNKKSGADGAKNKPQNRQQNKGNSKNDQHQQSPKTPPPSYQELHRSPYNPPPFPPQRPQHPDYGAAYYQRPGPAPYGPPPAPYGPPPAPYGQPSADPYGYDRSHYKDSNNPKREDRPAYDINITVNRPGEPPSPKDQLPRDPYYQQPRDPYYGGHPPPHSYGGHPPAPGAYPYYGQQPAAAAYPPPLMGYPSPYGGAPYDHHHAYRQTSQDDQQHGNSANRRGNDRGRGAFRGNRGRGGVNKNYKPPRNRNKKAGGKNKGSDSEDSDTSVASSKK